MYGIANFDSALNHVLDTTFSIVHHKFRSRRPLEPLSFFYTAYGLRLCCNLQIPRLIECPEVAAVDISVTLGRLPAWFHDAQKQNEYILYISPEQDDEGNPRVIISRSIDKSYIRFQYTEGADFIFEKDATQIWGVWLGNLTVEDVLVYLLGPVMGFVLRQRGLTCLHASAVAVKNRAIVFVGAAGAGKSTTAAAFSELGYPILSDDIVPLLDLGNSFEAQPGYPCICLWPESVETLFGSSGALPLLTSTWDKRYLPLNDERHLFYSKTLPIGSIYIVGNRGDSPDWPVVKEMRSGEGLISLISNTYMNYIPEMDVHTREFSLLARVAADVPIRRLHPHTDPSRLSKLCQTVIDDLDRLVLS